jgi:DNA polymerase kappa
MEFMRDLPVRKVNGVGRVFERELDSIGIKTCGDIYPHRALLTKLFGEKAFQFLAQCYLGLGRTKIEPVETHERKSVSTETTFHAIEDKEEFRKKLRWAADELAKDLERTQFKGRTLCLKVKLHTFEVLTRQTAPSRAVYRANDLYAFALPMLAKLEKEIPEMKLRLLGLRVSNLVSTKKIGINFFGVTAQPKLTPAHSPEISAQASDQNAEHDIGAEEAFENAARQEQQDEMNDLEQLSQEAAGLSVTLDPPDAESTETTENITVESVDPQPEQWECPICGRPQVAEDRVFNDHVDFCLSKQTIREVVQDSTSQETTPMPANKKRKTQAQQSSTDVDPRQKRLFFS